MADLNIAELLRVAARYRERVQTPHTLLRAKPSARPTPALAPPSSARSAYLSRSLARDRARAAVASAEASGAPGNAARTLAAISQERIIGKSDLLDMNYLELAVAVARGVARIRLPDGAATGFLVGPAVLMTNHHVLPSAAIAASSVAQFDYQENSAGELLPVQAFPFDARMFITDPDLDFTLIGITGRSTAGLPIGAYPWTKLIAAAGKIEKGEPINIVQHPLGGLKQIAFRNNEVIEVPSGKPDFLYYTTDTEPGSSGSPCFNDQWELVALHHSGVPRTKNGAVLKKDGAPYRDGKDAAADIDWIANEGARISAIVEALKSLTLNGETAAARDHVLGGSPPNPVELARRAPTPGGNETSMPAAEGTTTMNVRGISIRVAISGDAIEAVTIERSDGTSPMLVSPGQPAQPVPADTPADAETTSIDPDWKSREGYDPAFLGTQLPLPKLSAAQGKQSVVVPPEYRRVAKQNFVLNYHHYSLAFHAKRRLAWYSAGMIDGDKMQSFKRGTDKWFIDPRIDDINQPKFQMGEELYAEAGTDRGHLTRFLDLSWGANLAEAVAATNDSFHFTNCSLQVSGFNEGKDRWQGLEQFLLEQKARKEKRRMIVITGPVFKSNDPVYRNKHMSYAVRLPLSFWKICALIRADNTLAATGFVLGQPDAASLPNVEEKFDVTAAQVTIAHLQQITALDFGALKSHDHFAAGGAPGTLEVMTDAGKQQVRPLRSLEDIVM